MKIPLKASSSRAEVDMIPMINFAFLLLVFFLLAGRLAPAEALRVTPPVSARAQAESGGGDALLVAGDGRLGLQGATFGEAELQARIAAWRTAHPGAVLAVKADAALDASRAIAILGRLRDAGIVEVRLLAIASAD